jgi:hypothetical protein
VIGIGLGSDQFAICRELPEISAAGFEENAGESTEGSDELGGVVAFKGRAGKLE